MPILNPSQGSSSSTGFKLGIQQNTFDVGTGTRGQAETLRNEYAEANSEWLKQYQDDFIKGSPSSVLLLFTEDSNPIAMYTQYDGSLKGWRELSTAKGVRGLKGEDGKGICEGGHQGQVLSKRGEGNFETEWVDVPTTGYVDEAIKEVSQQTKEIIEINIKAKKGVKVSDLNSYFNLVKTKYDCADFNEQIPFLEFYKIDDMAANFDLWAYRTSCRSDLTFYLEYFDYDLDRVTVTSEEFITHSGRNDRVITLDLSTPYYNFEPILSVENATIEKAKSYVCETINLTVYLPKPDYVYEDIVISSQDADFGHILGTAKLKYFKKQYDVDLGTYLSGTMELQPDYNAALFCTIDGQQVEAETFKTLSNRSVRNVDLYVSEKRFDIGNGDHIVSAVSLEIKDAAKFKPRINLKFESIDYVWKSDKVVFIEESTGTAVDSIELVYAAKPTDDKQLMYVEPIINVDIYGHFELLDKNSVLVAKSSKFLTTPTNSDTIFNFDYTAKTCEEVAVGHGTYDMIKDNSSSGETIHNKLQNLQGGLAGEKGEFYHLNKQSFDTVVKLNDNKSVEVQRVYTKDVENNTANLVSISGFSSLFGNRLVNNTQFSNYRETFRHVFNNGKVSTIVPIPPSEKIPVGNYSQNIKLGDIKTGDTTGLYVTKIQIETNSELPQIGRLSIESSKGGLKFETCRKGMTAALVDNYGNCSGKVLFDIADPIDASQNNVLTCKLELVSDSVLGATTAELGTQPSICLVLEELQDEQIASINHIYELVPSAVSDESIFAFNVYDEQGKECLVSDINLPSHPLSPYNTLVVPEMFKGNDVRGLNCNINVNISVKSFSSNSIRWMEFEDTNGPYYFFDGIQELETIYLPNLEEVLHEKFINDCPRLKKLYVPKLRIFGINSDFITNCPELTVYTSVNNNALIKLCNDNNIKYELIDIPTTYGDEVKVGYVLSVSEDSKSPVWTPSVGGRDEMAIHKYPDLTKDFHTFFEPSASGVYRCFEMVDNIPEGYFAGDNDFYAFVYAVSEKYKTVEALDIRSGRRFTKCMLAGRWQEWIEWNNINQGTKVPVLAWSSVTESGSRLSLKLSDMGLHSSDILWITCGSRGTAMKVDDPDYLEDYVSSYFVDGDNITLWISPQLPPQMSQFEIYRFETTPITPPRGGCPYLKLVDVVDDITTAINRGEVVNVSLTVKSIELSRNPKIKLDFGMYSYESSLTFDGKARWSFEFPFQPSGDWDRDTRVTFTLSWQDQNGMLYNGFESVIKPIVRV